MNILCVNHTGAVSGAEHSLLDLLSGLQGCVNVRLACPPIGPLASAAGALAVPVDGIPAVDGSLKLHPRETPLAVSRLSVAAVRTALHARRMGAHVIHANSIRAGLLSVSASRMSGVPCVVHLRDRLPRSTLADTSLRLIATGADVVAANSQYTADGLRAVTRHGRLEVVYNPVDLARFDPSIVRRTAMRAQLGVGSDSFVMAVVGQISPWKGQLEAVKIVAQLRRRHHDAHLLIVGEPKFVSAATRYDNRAYNDELERTIRAHGAEKYIQLLGERHDVPAIMGSLDVLLVPSWEEPFGRVVVEAMALGIAVVATNVGGPSEIIRDGVDGVLLTPRDPDGWTNAIVRLVHAVKLREDLGEAARRRAQDFALSGHVDTMCGLYEQAARTRSSKRASA